MTSITHTPSNYLLTYLALSSSDPLLDNGHAARYRHLVRSAAAVSTSHQLIPRSCKSSLNVVRHVFFGLPLFLMPPSGVQSLAYRAVATTVDIQCTVSGKSGPTTFVNNNFKS